MNKDLLFTPVLPCSVAREFEREFFADFDEGGRGCDEREFMRRAAAGVARETLAVFRETFRREPRTVHVLAGKGHNAADALLAAALLCEDRSQITVQLFTPRYELAPATRSALSALEKEGASVLPADEDDDDEYGGEDDDHGDATGGAAAPCDGDGPVADVLLDGVFGHNFRPPLSALHTNLIDWVNEHPNFLLRVAVDMPSGLALHADLTVACGLVKAPLLAPENASVRGRLRLVEIGFAAPPPHGETPSEFVTGARMFAATAPAILAGSPLNEARPPLADKRRHGHLLILGGSRPMPGALLLNVRAALRAGVGLVTAFCPESVHAAFAAAAPEAMWVPWPETPAGGLALEGEHLLRERLPRATALLCGSGMGAEPETLALLESIAGSAPCPLVLDADALRPEIVAAALRRPEKTPPSPLSCGPSLALLPHAGEFERIAPALPTALPWNVAIARKGAPTVVAGGGAWEVVSGCDRDFTAACEILVCAGGPVLARGGSGDLLAGIAGALVARFEDGHGVFRPLLDAVALHAAAGDLLAAAEHPQTARLSALLDYLGEALAGAR
ncbi:MAG: bifunctional ADP-dependent NAD(P)H-hydrate dehydratase/NAD(P)H-hydrate epimerase [Puniceicoccales bacterium]|jgi:NAD(P)H-hydrate epimerase|nr:bifunctional ADP-dependent NAD(P)H-hydrate dehydratase/NAD(P)H-hydrate epimerase [Puniceicoccales bacterium]